MRRALSDRTNLSRWNIQGIRTPAHDDAGTPRAKDTTNRLTGRKWDRFNIQILKW